MDPNQTLIDLRLRLKAFHALPDGEQADDQELDLLRDIADAAEALDKWLTGGGFLPKPWSDGQIRRW